MDFGSALNALKAGMKVCRSGWNGNKAGAFVPRTREPVVHDGLCYILLDTGAVAICDAEDFEIVCIRRSDGTGLKEWYEDGSGYPSISIYTEGGQQNIRLHRLIAAPGLDHANGDRLDNRRRNLREATSSQNAANSTSREGSSSRFKGVTWDKSRDKWMAAIASGGASRTLGRFDKEEDAARAYDEAAREIHGAFARLNFPEQRMWIKLQEPDEHSKMTLPYIYMRTAQGDLVPWLTSQTDILATDWEVL